MKTSNQKEDRKTEDGRPEEETERPGERMSGGETDDAEAYRLMRQKIGAEPDVYAVLALSWQTDAESWLYLIKTPFATWPKFVVGYTDKDNLNPKPMFCCGWEDAARNEFAERNCGAQW